MGCDGGGNMKPDTRTTAAGPKRRQDRLVAVDSDGCVFDTMESKQQQCFHPEIIRHWQLEPIADEVRAVAEFVNLYSCARGQNRLVALLQTFEWLLARVTDPVTDRLRDHSASLRHYVESGRPLSNTALAEEVARTGNPSLRDVLTWSRAVDERIRTQLPQAPAFPGAADALAAMAKHVDIVVVSQTPTEALEREWAASGLQAHVQAIAGQEQGTKTEILQHVLATHRLAPQAVLMIGDAPGDWRAAQRARAWFFPIVPRQEVASWRQLHTEAFPLFQAGQFGQTYQQSLVSAFLQQLPAEPPAGGWPVSRK